MLLNLKTGKLPIWKQDCFVVSLQWLIYFFIAHLKINSQC